MKGVFMKRRKIVVPTIGSLIATSFLLSVIPAQADTSSTGSPSSSQKLQPSSSQSTFGSQARLIVHDDKNNVKEVSITPNVSLKDAFQKVNLNIDMFRDKNDTAINKDSVVEPNKAIDIYEKSVDGNSKEIDVPFQTEEVDDPTIDQGTSKVVQEGQNGKAIQTTITIKTEKSSTLENSFTVVQSPVKKIIHKGSKAPRNSATTSTGAQKMGTSNYSSIVSSLQDSTNGSEASKIALSEVGKPYVWGAGRNGDDSAFDCSGLIYYIYHTRLGRGIPSTAASQGAVSTRISWGDIQPGDIVYASDGSHIGIYVGNGSVVHAANSDSGVIVTPLSYFISAGYIPGRF